MHWQVAAHWMPSHFFIGSRKLGPLLYCQVERVQRVHLYTLRLQPDFFLRFERNNRTDVDVFVIIVVLFWSSWTAFLVVRVVLRQCHSSTVKNDLK